MTLLKARGVLRFKHLEPKLWTQVETESDKRELAFGTLTARGVC
jgi:hypothetical protein